MKYNYKYGDGGVVDETSAEFKALGDGIKAKKKESVESQMRYNYQYGDGECYCHVFCISRSPYSPQTTDPMITCLQVELLTKQVRSLRPSVTVSRQRRRNLLVSRFFLHQRPSLLIPRI